ncbi:DUF2818 family protein [Inhella gelatinilytica]
MSTRVLLIGPLRPNRAFGWRLLELLLLGAVWLVMAWTVEARMGQRHAQEWGFYVVLLCLLLTFAAPGFVWRYLRRHATASD